MPRWYWGLIGAIFYIEMLVIVSLRCHFPTPPDPVFKKPEPVEYHWTKGPYDDDGDFCWTDESNGQHYCWEEDI